MFRRRADEPPFSEGVVAGIERCARVLQALRALRASDPGLRAVRERASHPIAPVSCFLLAARIIHGRCAGWGGLVPDVENGYTRPTVHESSWILGSAPLETGAISRRHLRGLVSR
jgi:hypothetical protein